MTSIVLPTFNRARFLPDAIQSIRQQRLSDWELIIVDDGSTDDTEPVVAELCDDIRDRVKYVRQENQGAYPARNAGIRLATGDFVAFFDSDDLWLPHHLADCVGALVANPDLDWVYAACRMIDHASGRKLANSTFYVNDEPRPFMRLQADARGAVRIINDARTIECAVLWGLYCGLQNSVIRRRVFSERLFDVAFHNEAEDQVFPLRTLLSGFRLGYIDAVHVVYRVHGANSSAPGASAAVEKRLKLTMEVARGYETLAAQWPLPAAARSAVRLRLNREYFWHGGYAILWENQRRRDAVAMFERGLRAWPWSLSCWKTYLLARIRLLFAAA